MSKNGEQPRRRRLSSGMTFIVTDPGWVGGRNPMLPRPPITYLPEPATYGNSTVEILAERLRCHRDAVVYYSEVLFRPPDVEETRWLPPFENPLRRDPSRPTTPREEPLQQIAAIRTELLHRIQSVERKAVAFVLGDGTVTVSVPKATAVEARLVPEGRDVLRLSGDQILRMAGHILRRKPADWMFLDRVRRAVELARPPYLTGAFDLSEPPLPWQYVRDLEQAALSLDDVKLVETEDDPYTPYQPAQFFFEHHGLKSATLRQRARRGRLRSKVINGIKCYSVLDALGQVPKD